MIYSQLIILTGHRKSGTSMFHRLFDNHPDLYIYPVDISVLYAYFPFFTNKYKANPRELRSRLKKVINKSLEFLNDANNFSVEGFADSVCKELTDEELCSKEKVISSIAQNWVKLYYRSDKAKPFLFKETSQSIFLNEFLRFEVPIKMISLVRDPRDNYAAIKAGVNKYYSKMGENELESLASLINRSRLDLLSAKINMDKFPNDFLAVSFEDLVSDTTKNIKNICDFLGIEYSRTLEVPTSFGRKYEGNNFDGKKLNTVSSVNVNKWESRITEQEAKIIEYWLQDVMLEWGYKPKYSVLESGKLFADFYNWYNTKYFYKDSFEANISL